MLTILGFLLPIAAAAAYTAIDVLGRPRPDRGGRRTLRYQAIAFLPVVFSLYGPAALRLPLIVVFALAYLLWHGYRRLTGDTLRPESLVLAAKPDHFADAAEAAWADRGRLRPVLGIASLWLVVTLACSAALPPPGGAIYGSVALLGPALLVGLAIRAIQLRNHSAYPRAELPALIGLVNSLALTAKWLVTDLRGGRAAAQASYRYTHSEPDGPVLIAVIMGESIAVDRIGLFRPEIPGAPRLAARAAGGGQLTMIWRLGLAAGVASNSSLTSLMSGLKRPEIATGHRTLFELAKAQGFRTHYISPQPRSPLDMTGRLHALDTVETRENNAALVAGRADFMINDKLRSLPSEEREFFFFYQRVNHAPYYNHDEVGRREGIRTPRDAADILANYDIGLAAWDHHLEALLADLERRAAERPNTRCFLFVSSDHNEMLGEAGLWGHNISGRIECAVVPMILFTNAPEHPAARRFAEAGLLDGFGLAESVMAALGVSVDVEGAERDVSYVNNALPYGRAGYMTARCAEAETLDVAFVGKSGDVQARYSLPPSEIPGLRTTETVDLLITARAAPPRPAAA